MDTNPNFQNAGSTLRQRNQDGLRRRQELIDWVKSLGKIGPKEIPPPPGPAATPQENETWEQAVLAFKDNYDKNNNTERTGEPNRPTGDPDNNSPGSNVSRATSVWGEKKENVTQDESMAIPPPKSMQSREMDEDRNPNTPQEAERSKVTGPEENDWVYGYKPGNDSGQDGEMVGFLRSQGVRLTENPGKEDIARGVSQWTQDNGYASLDNDALRKMAMMIGEKKKPQKSVWTK